jgi:putative redox protein
VGEQRLIWSGAGLQFEGITTYGEPVVVGGDPEGPGAKSSDLLPVSLAACTAYDVVVILRKQRQDLRGLQVRIASVQDPDPPWAFRSIHCHFVLTGVVDHSKAGRAIDMAESKYCAVAATLRSSVEISHSHEVVPD